MFYVFYTMISCGCLWSLILSGLVLLQHQFLSFGPSLRYPPQGGHSALWPILVLATPDDAFYSNIFLKLGFCLPHSSFGVSKRSSAEITLRSVVKKRYGVPKPCTPGFGSMLRRNTLCILLLTSPSRSWNQCFYSLSYYQYAFEVYLSQRRISDW